MDNTIDETPPRFGLLSIDLGPVLHRDLILAAQTTGKSKSELVRLAVGEFLHSVYYNNLITNIDKNKKHVGNRVYTQNDTNILIEKYNSVFFPDTPGPRHFYPAVVATVKSAMKGGLTLQDLEELIEVAPKDPWIQDQIRSGIPPTLPGILSAKMISRLLVIKNKVDVKETRMSANDFIEHKYDILDKYFDDIPPDKQDDFRDRVMECSTQSEVRKVLKLYDVG